jgi:hypothetical protein
MIDSPTRSLPESPVVGSDRQANALELIAHFLESIDGHLAALSNPERLPDFEKLSHSIQDLAASMKKD